MLSVLWTKYRFLLAKVVLLSTVWPLIDSTGGEQADTCVADEINLGRESGIGCCCYFKYVQSLEAMIPDHRSHICVFIASRVTAGTHCIYM